MSAEQAEQLEKLVEKHIDGTLSRPEADALEAMVTGDATAARSFAALMQDHALLYLSADALPTAAGFTGISNTPRPLHWGRYIAAAAAIVILGLVIIYSNQQRHDAVAVVATLESSDYASWGDCTLPTAAGGELGPGTLRLTAGLATLRFASGAKVIMEGPAVFELIDPMTARLHSGIVVSDVPKAAYGFAIRTPSVVAVDHGTRFLTRVSDDGSTTVLDVLEGEVELIHAQTESSQRFIGGQTATATSVGIVDNTTPETPEFGVQRPGAVALGDSTVRITTNDGVGRDGTTVAANKDYHYNPALIMIKNSASDFRRKGYVAFDLAKIGSTPVKQARLQLTMVASGYGSMALSQTATFTVYGITDDELDGWPQGRMQWESAPANGPGTVDLKMDQVVALGTFKVPRGRVAGDFSVSTAELTAFVNSDANRIASIVIVCTTPNEFEATLVYAIAGKLHPTAQPPALHLTIE